MRCTGPHRDDGVLDVSYPPGYEIVPPMLEFGVAPQPFPAAMASTFGSPTPPL